MGTENVNIKKTLRADELEKKDLKNKKLVCLKREGSF